MFERAVLFTVQQITVKAHSRITNHPSKLSINTRNPRLFLVINEKLSIKLRNDEKACTVKKMRTILQVFVDVKGRAEASGRGERDGVVRRVLSDDAVLCGIRW